MYTINKQQLNNLLLGSSLLATGGGCLFEKKQEYLSDIQTPITILEKEDIQADELICTVYAVGPTSNQEMNFTDALKIGIAEVEKFAGDKIKAMFAGELGAEHLVFKISQMCDLGILDADGTGGRAVPEIVQDQFPLNGRNTTPAIIVESAGNTTMIEDMSPADLETTVRKIAEGSNDLVLVFDHIITGKDVDLLSCGNFKRAINLAEKLDTNFSNLPNIDVIDSGTIAGLKTDDNTDFFRAELFIQSEDAYKIFIQNENLILLKNDQPIVTCPNLIMLLDENNQPVHNSELEQIVGKQVTILTAKALPDWQTKKGFELFGPRRFGFTYPVCYLKS